MALLHHRTPLTSAERLAKRHLALQDTLALVTLFFITAVLAVLTFLLFQSYSQHEKDLAARWLRRGETALRAGKPIPAINALRSALAFAPGDRGIQIELAEALAKAGRLQEATAYFNSLWESEPGNGMINLQLARLAARTGRIQDALHYYGASQYGTWEGDGVVRRREVRLELVHFLLAHNRFGEARDELLVAAGNANDDEIGSRLLMAGLLEDAHAPADALHLYREIAAHHATSFAALQGAGRTAFLLGHYRTAQQYLERALTNIPASAPTSASAKAAAPAAATDVGVTDAAATDREQLAEATRLLDLYPWGLLPPRTRALRVLDARAIVRKHLRACLPAGDPVGGATTPNNASAAPKNEATLNTPPDALSAVVARWHDEPRRLTLADLLADPDREAAELDLVYSTEIALNAACGTPTGDDALLLRIAQAPDAVEQP